MKRKLLPFIFCFFALSVFGQEKEARKVDEFGRIPCGEFMARMDSLYQYYKLKNLEDAKIYVIFYEDNETEVEIWNKKLKKLEPKRLAPIRGEALNLAKAVPLYLGKVYKFSNDSIILIDGGFREKFTNEIWIVPKGIEAPKPTPTVDAKDVKFKDSKPRKTPDYTGCYDGYKE